MGEVHRLQALNPSTCKSFAIEAKQRSVAENLQTVLGNSVCCDPNDRTLIENHLGALSHAQLVKLYRLVLLQDESARWAHDKWREALIFLLLRFYDYGTVWAHLLPDDIQDTHVKRAEEMAKQSRSWW